MLKEVIKKSLQITEKGLKVNDRYISWPLIRDSDLSGLDPSTTQKTWATSDVLNNSKPKNVIENDDKLTIEWSDNSYLPRKSTFNLNLLANGFDHSEWKQFPPKTPSPMAWKTSEFLSNSKSYDLNELENSSDALREALTQLLERGLLFIHNIPDDDKTDQGCGLRKMISAFFGEIRNTFYGQTWDVRALGGQSRNVAYTGLDLKYHMDLLYFETPPRFQFLHSLKALPRDQSPQGHSLFLDSYRAAGELKKHSYDLLKSVPLVYEYNNDNHHYLHSHPLIEENNYGAIKSINYSPPFQSPYQPFIAKLDHDDQIRYLEALIEWNDILQRPELNLETRLSENECVVFDNRRVLHARRAFDDQLSKDQNSIVRWLKGAYVDGDAIWDRWRVLSNV